MHVLRTIAFAFAMLATTSAQDASNQLSITPPPLSVSLSADQRRILAGIRAGERRAIYEAGYSRDRIYLEALAAALRQQRPAPDDFTDVQQALARLGDSEQLQKAWCLAINERNIHGGPAIVRSIGGWFAIRVSDYLLTPTGRVHWERAMRREPVTDILYLPVEYYIHEALSEVVPNPPLKWRPEDSLVQPSAYVPAWRAFIAEHREELMLLQPTGEGVEFSPTRCKDGKVLERRR